LLPEIQPSTYFAAYADALDGNVIGSHFCTDAACHW